MLEALAVLIYGIVAYIAALVVAMLAHSPNGAAIAFASAGCCYLFQLVQLLATDPKPATSAGLDILMGLAILLLPASVIVSLLGY